MIFPIMFFGGLFVVVIGATLTLTLDIAGKGLWTGIYLMLVGVLSLSLAMPLYAVTGV